MDVPDVGLKLFGSYMNHLNQKSEAEKSSNQKWLWFFFGSLICTALVLSVFVFSNISSYVAGDLKSDIKKIKKVVKLSPNYQFAPSVLGKDYHTINHDNLNFYMDVPLDWSFYIRQKREIFDLALHPKSSNPSKFNKDYFQIDVIDVTRHGSLKNLEQLSNASLSNVKQLYKKRGFELTSKVKNSNVFNHFESREFSTSWVSLDGKNRTHMRSFVVFDQGVKKSVTVRSFYPDKLYLPEMENILSTLKIKPSYSH